MVIATVAPETAVFAAAPLDEPRVVLDDEAGLSVGDKVAHNSFGRGTVIAIDGAMLKIRFDSASTKTLNAAFAPLKKL